MLVCVVMLPDIDIFGTAAVEIYTEKNTNICQEQNIWDICPGTTHTRYEDNNNVAVYFNNRAAIEFYNLKTVLQSIDVLNLKLITTCIN